MADAEHPLETAFLRAVFDGMGAGLLVTDATGHITASNAFAHRILDRPGEQLLGHDLHDLLHRDEEGNEVPREACLPLTVLRSGRPAEGSDEFFLRGDGTLLPIIWAATPLRHEGADGAVIVFHNFKRHRDAAEQTAAHLVALEELTTRLGMVAEVSGLLGSTLEIPEMLDRLVGLLVPDMADWAVADLFPRGRTEEARRIAVHVAGDPATAESLKGPVQPPPRTPRTALARALYGVQPTVLDARDLSGEADEPLARAHQELIDRLGAHSAVVVPLHTRREVFGVLTVARTGSRPAYTETGLLVLNDIARRTGMAMESARLFEEQRHVAETMQRQLLTPLPQVDHLQLAARYQPAQRAAEIGGDWYDAFLLADGVMTLVIGDVVGHDLQAAAHMAEVRNMLRALAWDRQEPPSLIMRRLDEAMTNTSDAPMATAVLARIEGPEGGPWDLHWVNAGHPPPLLVTADGRTRYLEGGHGPLLGMSAALHLGLEWPDAREEIPERSTVLLYTDGLIESRDRPIDRGMAELRRHAGALVHLGLEDFLDELLARTDPSGDDVAVLALRLPSAGEGAPGDTSPPPPRHAHSPADPGRSAPGSRVEGTPVEDASASGADDFHAD
ncbi:serine phosphatase RsbU (regulator of sigma subunit) [Nocardiopsis sp. Huas11]|uniref:SpoIIE family protein phosphatase n=1 Tax=Nocardiopsis sp. Huas11 TaxID=2183912 RepID=UPI000EB572C5|nr:SpoIIE family protein phosphatase [Nocardiopsis sp. Huas11]RKS09584.1 serine phosphatase RsbU (regulator of sigma subunit) [Nocardiopsis sp. Huas11]